MSVETESAREQWLAARKLGIGASEAAAVLGVSPWKSPFELWSEKVGAVEPDDLSDNEAVEFGLRLEGVIADSFEERTGRAVKLNTEFIQSIHREFPWMRCTYDALQTATDEEQSAIAWMQGPGSLQIKTTSAWNDKEWNDGPPIHYQVQVQHELAVLNLRWGTLVVLVGGQKLRWFDVERNDAFIDAMIPRLRDFWDSVVSGNPPAPDGSVATSRALAKLYPEDNGTEIELPAEAAEWDRELIQVKAEIAELEKRETLAKNKLTAAIGDATLGLIPGGAAYSWKLQSRKSYTVKETSFRTLRRIGK